MVDNPKSSTLDTIEITINATDAEASARFWSAALGFRLLYEREPYVVLEAVDGTGPRVLIQRVKERAAGASSVHLDLRVGDPPAEVRRLVELGAGLVRVVEEADTEWTVMTDPEGTQFCVCPARASK